MQAATDDDVTTPDEVEAAAPADEPEVVAPEGDADQPAEEAAPAEEEEVQVSFGDQPEDEQPATQADGRAPDWLRELRKSNREKDRRIRELEQRVNASAQPAETVVGEKPTLAGCDFDEDKFSAALESWHGRKTAADRAAEARAESERKAAAVWQDRLKTYETQKAALKVRDFEDAEDATKDALSVTQQGVILQGAENPAVLVYALGKNPKTTSALAAITDPVKFAFAVAKLETQLKIANRKTAPLPEKRIAGSAPMSTSAARNLEEMRQKAQTTGDYSAYFEAKRRANQR